MNRFALMLGPDGKAHEIDPKRACTAETPGDGFRWLHLDGREKESFEWLRDHGALPETVAYALTAVETRPRCEPIGEGALINLRGLAAEGEEGDPLASIRMWAEAGCVISVSYRRLDGLPEIVDRMKDGALKDPGDLIAFLAISNVATFSWGSLRLRRNIRLEAIVIIALLGAAVASATWETLSFVALVYLGLIPFSVMSYARVRRPRAAVPVPAEPLPPLAEPKAPARGRRRSAPNANEPSSPE